MARTPWRFQCDIPEGELDPDVTVFLGDTFTNDSTGEKTVRQDTADPAIIKLSELPAALEDPGLLEAAVPAKAVPK
jgi:hypothetical protein